MEIINLASNNIFTIDCKDIILREFRLEDLDELYTLTLQPEITDILPDWKATKETNEFIGWCCTGPCDELPEPNREIGYALSKYHRNKGYTTQAVQGLIKYLFKKTNVEVLNTIALIHNVSSNRVIQKCEFIYMNNIEFENREFYHYKLSKNE